MTLPPAVAARARKIRFLLLDVDGVLTDGRIVWDTAGVETEFFDVRDGHGIVLAQRAGLAVGFLSGRSSRAVEWRAQELGVTVVRQGALDKSAAFAELLAAQRLEPEEVAYVGDDVVDLPILRRVGFSVAVADAHPVVRDRVDYVTTSRGGRGAVREVTDLLLTVLGRWEEIMRRYEES